MTARDVDNRINRIAKRQYGAFDLSQAKRSGATFGIRRRRLEAGTWDDPEDRVYVLSSSLGTWHRQVKVATLAVPGSAAYRETAAVLHGFSGFRPGHVHVVADPTARHDLRTATLHRSVHIESTWRQAIRVVTVADTLVSLAGVTSDRRWFTTAEGLIVADRRVLARSRIDSATWPTAASRGSAGSERSSTSTETVTFLRRTSSNASSTPSSTRSAACRRASGRRRSSSGTVAPLGATRSSSHCV